MQRTTKSLLLASVALILLPAVAWAADEKKQLAYDTVEKNAQNQLQRFQDRSSFDPGKADGSRPN